MAMEVPIQCREATAAMQQRIIQQELDLVGLEDEEVVLRRWVPPGQMTLI